MAPRVDYFVSLNSPWTHLGAARVDIANGIRKRRAGAAAGPSPAQ